MLLSNTAEQRWWLQDRSVCYLRESGKKLNKSNKSFSLVEVAVVVHSLSRRRKFIFLYLISLVSTFFGSIVAITVSVHFFRNHGNHARLFPRCFARPLPVCLKISVCFVFLFSFFDLGMFLFYHL